MELSTSIPKVLVKLSGKHLQKLHEALIDAFPTESSLAQMLHSNLGKSLNAIIKGQSLSDIVFQIIRLADAEGWLSDLIIAAISEKTVRGNFHHIFVEILEEATLLEPIRIETTSKKIDITKLTFASSSLRDFEPSSLWSFQHCSLLLENLLNERQREEWIGDLEEVLYKMYDLKCQKWQFHFEILRRVFYLSKSLFIFKVSLSSSKKKSIK